MTNKYIFRVIFITLLAIFLFFGKPVFADGGLIPYNYEDLYEPSQTALIAYGNGQEDLYLKVNYEGETNKFVWLVPTPHYPEVDKAPKDIFEELSDYTQISREAWKDEGLTSGQSLDTGVDNVIVHEQKQVGIYEVTILSATGSQGLLEWLNNNKYQISQEVKSSLDWYVAKEWYFVAMRIEGEEESQPETVNVYSDYIEPIKISFVTRTIVYPLKISQMSTKVLTQNGIDVLSKTNEVLVYILDSNQTMGPGFRVEYAEAVTRESLEQVEETNFYTFDSLKEIIGDKEWFLTKLRREFARGEMDEDVYFITGTDSTALAGNEFINLSQSYEENSDYAESKGKVVGSALSDRLKGRIVLKVEENGEAYYINPITKLKRFLGRPTDAFQVMRDQGVGITNNDLVKIPVGLDNLTGADTDGDGLSDAFEDALGSDKARSDTDSDGYSDKDEIISGYSPISPGALSFDYNFANNHKGKIFLQVESHGEAWYVNPIDGKRYFLGRPADAYEVMRNLGLGISNEDFAGL
jgi:hypothetical protein